MRFGTARDEDSEEGICVSAVFKVFMVHAGNTGSIGQDLLRSYAGLDHCKFLASASPSS
jgi:hypothetical protein